MPVIDAYKHFIPEGHRTAAAEAGPVHDPDEPGAIEVSAWLLPVRHDGSTAHRASATGEHTDVFEPTRAALALVWEIGQA